MCDVFFLDGANVIRRRLCYWRLRFCCSVGAGDLGGRFRFPFLRPRSWLRLCRCAGSSVSVSSTPRNGCDFVDVPGLIGSFAFAPACAYVYDDYDLAVGRGFRAGVRLNTLHSCCGAVDFGLRRGHAGLAFGPGSCDWRVLLQWPWRSRWGRLSD